MRYKPIDDVQQGEHLGKPIYSSNGRVLLQKGVQLTPGILTRLRRMGISVVYIDDKRFEDVIVEEVVSESTKREAIETISESIQCIQSGNKDVNTKQITKMTTKIIDEILTNSNVLINLGDIRTNDNHLFVHSVNVCIMSVVIGVKMGMVRDKLKELAMGALFHDVGKVINQVPNNVNQPQMDMNPNDHTWKGFYFLKQRHDISLLSATVALQHHECMDGTGYPRGLKSKEIHPYAQIVSVANFYDNLISSSQEGEPLHPFQAGEKIMGLTNTRFAHDVVWNFLRAIAFYPTGSQVKLSNGLTGIVVGQHYGLPQRPIIRSFKTNHIDPDSSYSVEEMDMNEIDLAKETTVFIEAIVS